MHGPPDEKGRPDPAVDGAPLLNLAPPEYTLPPLPDQGGADEAEIQIAELRWRLEAERYKLLSEMAADPGSGLPDLQRLAMLAHLQGALDAIAATWRARP